MKILRSRNDAKMPLLIAAIVVLLIVLIVMLAQSGNRNDEQLFDERSNNIINVTEKSADVMKLMLEDAASSLSSAEKAITTTTTTTTIDSSADIAAYVQELCAIERRSGRSDYIVLVDGSSSYHMIENGSYRTGPWVDFDVLSSADEEMSFSVTTLPNMQQQTYLALTKRFAGYGTLDGEQGAIRYVMVCINTDDFAPAFDVDMFDRQNFYYVVDSNGHRMFRYVQGTDAIDTLNIFAALQNCTVIHGSTVDELRDSVSTGQTASSEIKYEDTSYFVSCVPLQVNNWAMLMFVPTDVLSASSASYTSASTVFTFGVASVFSLLLVCIALLGVTIVNRQRAAEAQRAVNEQLAKANELIAQASEAKTNFLFNMSHDIRTPINAIVGFTNMAMRNTRNPELVEDCLGKTQQASRFLSTLIDDILEMSRIESGKMSLSRDKVDIAALLEGVRPVIDELAGGKDHVVTYEVDALEHPYAYADSHRIERILVNLLSNAVKYTPRGGKIVAHVRELGASCDASNSDMPSRDGWTAYEFSIVDNGVGMSAEFQKDMFDTFTREEDPTTTNIQGTGLGLALCKSIADLMHANLTCTSVKGEGSTFMLTVPLEIVDPDDFATAASLDYALDLKWLDGKRCLLVEDNELNREIAVFFLEDMGLIVEEAPDGVEAVETLARQGATYYDIVFMDIQMPRMNGYDAARKIREMYPDVRVPIIALSANAFVEDKMKSLEAGMDAHVAKPLKPEEIAEAVHTVLTKKK